MSALYDKKEWIQEVIELPFEIIYIDDPTGVEGDERIIQEGISGLKQVNYDVYYIDGIEIFREPIELFDKVIQKPVNQIIGRGTIIPIVSLETKTIEIDFTTEYIKNPDLLIGTEEVTQEGRNGIQTIIEEVTTIEGEEIGREVISNEITTAPVNKVVQVGTKALELEDTAPVDPGVADITVESTDGDLPPTGVASTTATSILGALALSIGSVLGFRKKKK